VTVARLASSVWISHRISKISRLAPLTQSARVTRLADTTDFSVPDIAAPGKVPIGLRARTSLTTVWRIGIAVESLSTLMAVISSSVTSTVLRKVKKESYKRS